ncbi:hypothetical protein [Pseudonocardia sp. D17]|uniref:hypothetical protein n=1 Tax=Pseudonocardia sp. D17 TaxID=882661 RepID=UPI002B3FD67F|nr:hypothetical protein PSD17_55410 [Pseudonocardia sp. D17]
MTEQQQTTNTTTTTEPAGAAESTEQEPFDAERAMEKIRKTNSENAGLRKRLKELEQYEAAARAAEDAKKSEAQRFAEQLADANRRAEEAELGRLRERVARRAQLPDELADRLRGNTEEELTADAKALAALTANAQAAGREERRKAPDPSQGQGMALNGDPLLDSLRSKLGI